MPIILKNSVMLLFKTSKPEDCVLQIFTNQNEQHFLNNVTPMSPNWIKVYSLALMVCKNIMIEMRWEEHQ